MTTYRSLSCAQKVFFQTPSVNGSPHNYINDPVVNRNGRRIKTGTLLNVKIIKGKIITVEDEPDYSKSALSDRTRRKKRRVQDPFRKSSDYSAILPWPRYALENRSIDDRQVAVKDMIQMLTDRISQKFSRLCVTLYSRKKRKISSRLQGDKLKRWNRKSNS